MRSRSPRRAALVPSICNAYLPARTGSVTTLTRSLLVAVPRHCSVVPVSKSPRQIISAAIGRAKNNTVAISSRDTDGKRSESRCVAYILVLLTPGVSSGNCASAKPMWCAIELSEGASELKLNPRLPSFSRQYTFLSCASQTTQLIAMRALGYLLAAALFVGALTSDSACAFGADAQSAADPSQPFFAQHCQDCHAGPKPKGDFRLESLSQDFADNVNRKLWLKVFEQVKEGTMPPAKKPRPPTKDVETLAAWISDRTAAAETAASASRGRVVMRRLNRTEYKNTVRDLLGVDVELDDVLPEDTSSGGFDNSAEALHISSYLLDGYLEAADRVIDAAVAGGPQPRTIKKRFDVKDERSVKPTGSVYRHVDDGVAIFSSWVSANIQVALWQFTTRTRGKYRIRVSSYGIQTAKPVTFHVMVGPSSQVHQRLVDYFEAPPDKPTVVEFVAVMNPQETIRVVTDGLPATPPDITKVGADNYKGPGLVIQWIDIDGPLGDSWPPESYRGLFGDLPQEPVAGRPNRREVVSQHPLVDAERILRDFTRRAFRRPITDEEIKPFLARVQAQLE